MIHLDVAAALIMKNGKVMLCQRKADDNFGLLWEFPGGGIEKGETSKGAIKREIKEETGLEIHPDKIVGIFNDTKGGIHIRVRLFKCDIISGEASPIECRDIKFTAIDKINRFNLAPVDKKIALYLRKSI